MGNHHKNIHDKHIENRLRRLMSGDLNISDVEKIYSGKRFFSYGRASFREIADFAAHPDLRNRGPITDRIRDMRTTFKPMIDRAFESSEAKIDQIFDRAESNLRMATDEQIARLSGGRRRKGAAAILKSALEKLRRGDGNLTPDEELLALNFGDRVIWNPALRAQEVFEDFKIVMLKNGLMSSKNVAFLEVARSLIVLHAIAVMHGTEFDIGDGIGGVLQAGYNNKEGCLEVTAGLHLTGYPKRVTLKLGLFWTDLKAFDHIGEPLTSYPGPWDFPIEIRGCKLHPIGEITESYMTDPGTKVIKFPH